MVYALDLETLAADLLQDVGTVATAPIPPTIFGHAPQTPYGYDPDNARSLLAEAGLEDGFDTHVIWVPGSGPQDRELVLSFISYWSEIGVNVESREMEQAAWLVAASAIVLPLLGLLGTVLGMLASFEVIQVYGTGQPRLLAGGIGQALLTTQAGLLTAVPVLFFHHIIHNRIRLIRNEMELLSHAERTGNGKAGR